MQSRSGLAFEVGGDFDFTQNKNEYPHYFKLPQSLFYAGVRSEDGRLWDLRLRNVLFDGRTKPGICGKRCDGAYGRDIQAAVSAAGITVGE